MATYYWVGGSGTWNSSSTTNWSLTSGGAGGAGYPTGTDDVIINSSSGTGTITAGGNLSICRSLTCTGYTGTLSITSAALLVRGGNLTLSAGMNLVMASTTSFGLNGPAGGTSNITTAGKSIDTISFEGDPTATFTLLDNITCVTFAVGSGVVNTNGKTVNCSYKFYFGTFSASAATLNLGASVINCGGNFDINPNNKPSCTLNAGTSSIRLNATFATFSGDGKTYYEVQFNEVNQQLLDSNTFTHLKVTGTATKTGYFIIHDNQTVTGTLTLNGNSAINRLFVRSSTHGTSRTISAASKAISNVDFRDIAITGAAAPLSGTSLGDAGGNTGISFTPAVTRYAVAAGAWSSTATWSTSSGGASGASVPLCHDNVVLNASSGTGSISMDMPRSCRDLTCTSFVGTLALGSTEIAGNITLSSGMLVSGGDLISFKYKGRSSTITSNGVAFRGGIAFDTLSGTLTLSDSFISISSIQIYAGGGILAQANVQAVSFTASSTSNVNLGSGTWTVSGTGTVWNVAAGTVLSFSAGSTILLSNTTTSARIFAGGGKSYGNLVIGGSTGTSILTLTGSNKFEELSSTKTVAHTIQFTAATNTEIKKWSVSGTAGNLVTVKSVTTAVHTLTYTGTDTVSAAYLNLSYSTATPAATWYAGTTSVDSGNNTGWMFIDNPASAGSGRNTLFFGAHF